MQKTIRTLATVSEKVAKCFYKVVQEHMKDVLW